MAKLITRSLGARTARTRSFIGMSYVTQILARETARIVERHQSFTAVSATVVPSRYLHRDAMRGRATPVVHKRIVCTKCHWRCAHPSRRRSLLDALAALFLLRPYRCRSCQRRQYRFSIPEWSISRRKVKTAATLHSWPSGQDQGMEAEDFSV
jgi:hypothetical protein